MVTRESSKRQHRRKERGDHVPEESGVGDGLGIRSDHVVFFITQMDITRFETFEDILDHAHMFFGASVVDDDLRLVRSRGRGGVWVTESGFGLSKGERGEG